MNVRSTAKWRTIVLLLLFICSSQQVKLSEAQEREETSPSSSETKISLEDDEPSPLDLDEIPSNELDEVNRFELRHHIEDHGVYSGRSLSSTKNIKPQDELYENYGEDEEVRKSLNKKHFDEDESPLRTVDYAEKEWQLMFRAFDLAYESATSSILHELNQNTNLFGEVVSRLPPACQRDIYYVREAVQKHRLWALRMLDSNGKIPSGITYGRFSSPGDYEECLTTRVNEFVYRGKSINNSDILEGHKFHGKYCLLDFRLPLPERPRNKLLSIHESVLNFTGTELERLYPEFVKNYSSYASVFYEVGYMHAFCLPSTCKVEDLTKSLSKTLEGMYIIVNNTVDCEEWPDEGRPLRTSQVISLLIMGFVFTNALLASIAYQLLPQGKKARQAEDQRKTNDNAEKHPDRGLGWLESLRELAMKNRFYANCFSIQRNFERLSKPDPRGLTFVHYTRIVAMALTVITHTGALGTLQAITKPADASNSEQIFRDFLPQMLANAFTSIQIFFFMAGFMLVISTYPAIRRDKGRMSFLEYVIKRAIRLMPGIAATICLNFIWPLVVEGPMLTYFIRMIVEPCESTWWHTLGFVSNFDHVEKMCLRHSYFSASDYQLHVAAFPLLLLLYKQPVLSLFLAALLTVCGFVAQVIMILTKNVLPFMMVDYIDKEAFFNVIHYIHHPVWNHMSAFFYGFIIGYLVVRQIRVNLSQKTVKRIWIVLLPMGILSIFAPYYWNHYKRPISRWQMILYAIFDRFILLSTCAWLSYASMVLARRPSERKPSSTSKSVESKPSADEQQAPPTIPVSVIIQPPSSPEEPKLQRNELALFETASPPQQGTPVGVHRSAESGAESALSGLRPTLSSTPMPRQRSSPNLINELQQQNQQLYEQRQTILSDLSSVGSRRLFRTTSGSNLATITESSSHPVATELASAVTSGNASKVLAQVELSPQEIGPTKPVASVQRQEPPKRPTNKPPISNINTLCLILSRLTFQLYLFNMVVLWIDVNQSKYYWFFSYYFIIVKASAVYIASAIMAMVFFVVLESPCLTLYIAWVRGRASARAKISNIAPTVLVEPGAKPNLNMKK